MTATRRGLTREQMYRFITEDQLQAVIIETAQRLGWWVYHTHDSRRSEDGWPDLVLLRPPRALFVELKRETGKVSSAQGRVLELLEGCGLNVSVIRPSQQDQFLAELGART